VRFDISRGGADQTVTVTAARAVTSRILLAQCSAGAAPTPACRSRFKLLPSRHMLLAVRLNRKGPYNLIFDTGAPPNLVNPRWPKRQAIQEQRPA